MPETRKGSKGEVYGDVPLTLSLFKEELASFKTHLEYELKTALKKELIDDLSASISSMFRSELHDLKERVKQLSEENEKLKLKSADQLEEIVVEVSRRHDKRNKIIISNLPEPSSGSLQERKDEDRKTVHELARVLGLSYFSIQETQRIGKIDSSKPRLLCTTCADKNTKFDFLRSARDLRKSEKYKHCFINPDLTFAQREKNRTLRRELNEKREPHRDLM